MGVGKLERGNVMGAMMGTCRVKMSSSYGVLGSETREGRWN